MLSIEPQKITGDILGKLYIPPSDSHKGQNGKLLIIGGSKKYHGAPILAAKVASKIVDLVYFSSVPQNNELASEMKFEMCEFITVERNEVEDYMDKVDVVLIGPGLEVSDETATLVNDLLKNYPQQKFVADADALKVLDKGLLGPNHVLTPNSHEFKLLFNLDPTKENVFQMAAKYQCVIVLKGEIDYISDGTKLYYDTNGNAGLTKGGTGDVLAGLIAALACKNSALLAAQVGVFALGVSATRLFEKVSYYYNASDLIDQIPRTMKGIGG